MTSTSRLCRRCRLSCRDMMSTTSSAGDQRLATISPIPRRAVGHLAGSTSTTDRLRAGATQRSCHSVMHHPARTSAHLTLRIRQLDAIAERPVDLGWSGPGDRRTMTSTRHHESMTPQGGAYATPASSVSPAHRRAADSAKYSTPAAQDPQRAQALVELIARRRPGRSTDAAERLRSSPLPSSNLTTTVCLLDHAAHQRRGANPYER